MNNQEDILTQRIQKIKDWCHNNGFSYHIDTKGKGRIFTIGKNKKGERLVGIFQGTERKGEMYAYIANEKFPGDLKQRNILVDELKKINFYDNFIDPYQIIDCRSFKKKLQDFTNDELDRFLNLIVNVYSAKKPSDEDVTILSRLYGDYLPTKDDFESAYRMLCSPGQQIDKSAILDQIEINAINSRRNLKTNWRLITERNIDIWVKEA